MRKTRTIVTGVALAAAFSLAACTRGAPPRAPPPAFFSPRRPLLRFPSRLGH